MGAIILQTSPARPDPYRAEAGIGYSHLSGDGGFHGAFGEFKGGYIWAESFGILGGYRFEHFEGNSGGCSVHNLSLTARYALDVFRYIPWVAVEPSVSFADAIVDSPDVGLGLSLGLDYLLDERWILTFALNYQKSVGEGRERWFLGPRLAYQFTFGDPFEP